jgi:hypothetical protein
MRRHAHKRRHEADPLSHLVEQVLGLADCVIERLSDYSFNAFSIRRSGMNHITETAT